MKCRKNCSGSVTWSVKILHFVKYTLNKQNMCPNWYADGRWADKPCSGIAWC